MTPWCIPQTQAIVSAFDQKDQDDAFSDLGGHSESDEGASLVRPAALGSHAMPSGNPAYNRKGGGGGGAQRVVNVELVPSSAGRGGSPSSAMGAPPPITAASQQRSQQQQQQRMQKGPGGGGGRGVMLVDPSMDSPPSPERTLHGAALRASQQQLAGASAHITRSTGSPGHQNISTPGSPSQSIAAPGMTPRGTSFLGTPASHVRASYVNPEGDDSGVSPIRDPSPAEVLADAAASPYPSPRNGSNNGSIAAQLAAAPYRRSGLGAAASGGGGSSGGNLLIDIGSGSGGRRATAAAASRLSLGGAGSREAPSGDWPSLAASRSGGDHRPLSGGSSTSGVPPSPGVLGQGGPSTAWSSFSAQQPQPAGPPVVPPSRYLAGRMSGSGGSAVAPIMPGSSSGTGGQRSASGLDGGPEGESMAEMATRMLRGG